MKSLFVCPRCNQRAVRDPYSGDFVHECFGTSALANEDVLVIGDWTDYTGSNLNVSPAVLKAGQENTLQGTRADIEGAKNPGNRSSRGFPSNRFRTRQHLEYIHEKEFKKTETSFSDPEEYTGDA